MDAFEAPTWSLHQAVAWITFRSVVAVRMTEERITEAPDAPDYGKKARQARDRAGRLWSRARAEARFMALVEPDVADLQLQGALRSGRLAATGMVGGVRHRIPSMAWPRREWGLSIPEPYTSVEVNRADVIQLWPFSEEGWRDAAAAKRSGAPGRPGVKHLVDQEFERRQRSGAIRDTLRQEAEELLDWLKSVHPDKQPGSVKTIENNIRTRYRSRPTK